jgi:hypothetical protein
VLANGTPEDSSPTLWLRAQALTRPEVAPELGKQLRCIVEAAHNPRPVPGIRLMGAREPVLAAEHDLATLANRLQSGAPIPARGIAKINLLLSDGSGPLFNRHSDSHLREELQQAISATH